jgi:5-methylcytosine-specific restriction enzyme A
MTAGEFPPKVRRAVMIRAWFACERDGRTDGLQVHHRRPRQAGGTADPLAASVSNALVLCHVCHAWVESHRTAATARGWLVPAGADPATVPALVYELAGPALLTAEGAYTPVRRAA